MDLFGPKEGDKYEKALQLQLTGKPSALAKELVELLCVCDPPLSSPTCCAVDTVTAMWRRALPQVVRSAVAGRSLRGTNFDKVIQTADDVYASLAATPLAAVSPAPEVNDNQAEVAAYRPSGRQQPRANSRTRGLQSRGASGRGRARSRGNRFIFKFGAKTKPNK